MDEFGIREGFTKKSCCSFGFCPNYLQFPPTGKYFSLLGKKSCSFSANSIIFLGAGKGGGEWKLFHFFHFPTQVNYLLSVLLLCSLNPDLPSFNASKALFNNSCYTFLLCIKSNSLLSVQQMNYDVTRSSNVRLQLKHDALHLRSSQWKPVWL